MSLLFCEKHKEKLVATTQNGKTVYACLGCGIDEYLTGIYRRQKRIEKALKNYREGIQNDTFND